MRIKIARIVTSMLVTDFGDKITLCSCQVICDILMVRVSIQNHFFNVKNLSSTSTSCHQHEFFSKNDTNIDVAILWLVIPLLTFFLTVARPSLVIFF